MDAPYTPSALQTEETIAILKHILHDVRSTQLVYEPAANMCGTLRMFLRFFVVSAYLTRHEI